MHRFILLALLVTVLAAPLFAEEKAPPPDETLYLKARALARDGKHEEALGVADEVLTGHPESPWGKKALFLKARSLVELRRYRPAEEIYEREAERLLGEARKRRIAGVIIEFADALAKKPDPNDLGAPAPNYRRAYNLYSKVLEMEIGRGLRDEVMFRRAETILAARDFGRAQADFRAYLSEFDPDWTGIVGSAERFANLKRKNPPPAGRFPLRARYHLSVAQLGLNQHAAARRNLEDLLALLPGREGVSPELAPDARWKLLGSFRLPTPANHEADAAIGAAREFLKLHGDDPRAVVASYWIAETDRRRGRADDAVAGFRDLIETKGFTVPAEAEKLEGFGKTPAELHDEWRKLGLFQIGRIRFDQKRYDLATEVWRDYVRMFPNGAQWSDSQRGIIAAEYELGLVAVAEKDYETARSRFSGFLTRHPLDERARTILFLLGQIHNARGEELEKEGMDPVAAKAAWRSAIEEWERLVKKYPNTLESSHALYRIGVLREEKLGELEAALADYRRLTWGPQASAARARVALMTQKNLELETERKFRTNEPVVVKLDVRNVEKVEVKRYTLDLEAYFRKTHGTGRVEDLDIALIQPDSTFTVEIEGYEKYRPFTKKIEIPMENGRPGVCLVNVSEEDFEATTLVVRSDLDLVVRSSRREVLVYAQDMLADEPASGVRLLLSDGKKVFATAETGKDGVYRGRHDELENVERVSVFAHRSGSIASNALDLRGLSLAKGLAPKGYIYTDRPAYRPGHEVKVRGIIRNVKDGSYAAPAGEVFVVSVTDSQGRLIFQTERTLTEFGSFDGALRLDSGAPVGSYRVTAHRKGEPKSLFSGTFHVQDFKLRKMRLVFEPDRRVYFRGETVEMKVRAEYYWGEAVADKGISLMFPDGRKLVVPTDPKGEIAVRFETTGMSPGAPLHFVASIEGEDVIAHEQLFLARLGFGLSIKTERALVLAGEPFDVSVKATAPDGEPVRRELKLLILRRELPKPDPVLAGVPWIRRPAVPAAEVTVDEEEIVTHAESGIADVALRLEEGGEYVFRVVGTDRFGQTVTASGKIRVSDDEDAVKLRFFADSDTLKVGETASIRLHSRLEERLALLTFDGEEVLSHRVVRVKGGMNDVPLEVGHRHFPNFRVTATVLDGRDLRTAFRPFAVERELTVTMKPEGGDTSEPGVFPPGTPAKVRIRAVDQLGEPVRAELALSLVPEALYALFPDRTAKIVEFFQKDARRKAEFRVVGTSGFKYSGATRKVVKEILAEEERRERVTAEANEVARMRQSLRRIAGRQARLPTDPQPPAERPGGAPADRAGQMDELANAATTRQARGGLGRGVPAGGKKAPTPPRREVPGAGAWIAAVVTDENGEAVVTLPMPETTTRWRVTGRGVSVETLVGEATTELVTRKDFFVTAKMPASLLEGDKVRVLARLHNLTDEAGTAVATLRVYGGTGLDSLLAERTLTAALGAKGGAEALFDEVEAPAGHALRFVVTATLGDLEDSVSVDVPVRGYGMEYAAHAGGTARSSETALLELPTGHQYRSKRLTVTVGPSLERAVIEMALGTPLLAERRMISPPAGGHPGSDLLAVTAALRYAREIGAPAVDQERLSRRIQTLVGTLVVSQGADGGWPWVGRRQTVYPVSAMSYWALTSARGLGFPVHAETLAKAAKHLKDQHRQLGANDNDGKSVILHALSTAGAADFAHLNRLYRTRNALSATALAYTALAFVNIERDEFARELYPLLIAKARETTVNRRVLCSVRGVRQRPLVKDDEIETTALTLLLMQELGTEGPKARQLADFLLHRRGTGGFVPAKARGAAIAALARYFGKGKYAATDAKLTVRVGGEVVRTIEARGGRPLVTFAVPAERIGDGRVRVEFLYEGRGEFAWAATLTGFSERIQSAREPRSAYFHKRHYRHAQLTYRGRPIGVDSTSPVKHVEVGQRVRVWVDMNNATAQTYLILEEPIPAGMVFVAGSLTGRHTHHEVRDGVLRMYFAPGTYHTDYHYELVGFATGDYRVLPPRAFDAVNPAHVRFGKPAELSVLTPGEKSDDTYVMNDSERYTLAHLHFTDGLFREALPFLEELFGRKNRPYEREVARMLLWIYTSPGLYDAKKIVDSFEVLRERYPELFIPFDKILVVGRAYRDIGEFERAWLVFRATIDASFINDANVSAVLEDEGQFMGSIDFQERLWREYPDTAEVTSTYFALSQALYMKAPKAHELAKDERRIARDGDEEAKKPPTRIDLLKEAIRFLESFLTLYPDQPLADDAAFSMANAFLDLKQYDSVVDLCTSFEERFPGSEFVSGFRYMTALGHFWQHDYDPALAAAREVAEGESKDRDFARYISGQIHHAKSDPANAITWYERVKTIYSDAKEAIDYFREKRISLEEVTVIRPGEPAEIEIGYRNIAEANLQVYRVDLMRLYLREKNLSTITRVRLAGIRPELTLTVPLGDGKDYMDKEIKARLDLTEEAAYLVICRGDDLFASGLVLITPLEIEVQEDPTSGRLRANVLDTVNGGYAAEVHVKAIGSADKEFRSGETDLRGIFIADGLRGKATVIARAGDSRYAFYRGAKWLGAPAAQRGGPRPSQQKEQQLDYRQNLRGQNSMIQDANFRAYDQLRRTKQKGVEVQQAR